jgi:DNA invertase Pin-like site-specific DNA recombinase
MKVAIYARFSTDHQDASSIEQQEYRCRRTAEARGWKVVAVYADHAKSGKSLDRPEMERLLADVRQRGGAGFDLLMVDDLSRLSRDLADTMSLVYRELPTHGIQLFDCTTGQVSDAAGARLTFGALALVNDAYLQSVRTQTHRGLEHRARGGFATGGRLYGYRTVPEPNPTDPEHPRKVPEIDPVQADVVRRIFADFLGGKAPARIAKDLNAERVPAPLDDSARKKPIKGWPCPPFARYFATRSTRATGRGTRENSCPSAVSAPAR